MKDYKNGGEYMEVKNYEKNQHESVIEEGRQLSKEIMTRGMTEEEKKAVRQMVRSTIYKWKDPEEVKHDYYKELIAINSR